MSFSRSHRRASSSQRNLGRDRHEIVGLSGWLFADLLLAVAVIFLVATVEPVFSDLASIPSDEIDNEPPGVILAFVPPLPIRDEDGLQFWKIGDGGVVVEVRFSEPVKEFGNSIEDLFGDLVIEADGVKESDWNVQHEGVTSNSNSNAKQSGAIYNVRLRPPFNIGSGKVSLRVVKNAAIDGNGKENTESKKLEFFVVTQSEKRIDTENSSQLIIQLPQRSCNEAKDVSVVSDLATEIISLPKWEAGVAGEKSVRRIAGVERSDGNFGDWIEKEYGTTARVGFVFIYGSGSNGQRVASDWQKCIFAAFKKLKFIDQEEMNLAYKTFKDDRGEPGKLKIEIYFYADTSDK